jgi:hypothetical protein
MVETLETAQKRAITNRSQEGYLGSIRGLTIDSGAVYG